MLPTSFPEGAAGGAMETRRREASFSYDSGPARRGRREHWRPIDFDPIETALLRRREAASAPSVDVFSIEPEAVGTDAA